MESLFNEVYLISCAGKTRQLYVKKWDHNIFSHFMQN